MVKNKRGNEPWWQKTGFLQGAGGAVGAALIAALVALISNTQPNIVQQNSGDSQGIITTGSGEVNIGISADEFRNGLKEKEAEIRRLLVNKALSEKDVFLLRKKIDQIELQRRNEISSYENYVSSLKQQVASLAGLPDKLFKEARQSLINGNTAKAKELFIQIEKQEANHLKKSAEAAYQRGMLAKIDLDYEESYTALDKAVRLQPKNSTYLSHFAEILQIMDKHEKALDYLLLTLEFYDENSLDEINALRGIGSIYYSLGQYNKAVEYSKLTLKKSIKINGEESLYVALARANLGNVYLSLGDLEQAFEYLELALEYLTKTFGKKHLVISSIHNSLGQYYKNKHQLSRARDHLILALESGISVLGLKHPNVAIYHSNLGNIYSEMGLNDKAIEHLQFALESDLYNFGKNHSYVARDHNGLGMIYLSLGEIEKGIEHLETSLNITSGLLGVNHPYTKITKDNLAYAKRLLEK
ncbi:MAG: tetratricopeptide (TPR) repeat protein [Oleiphilaceae bacterium]